MLKRNRLHSKFFPGFDLDKCECVVCGKRAGDEWSEQEDQEPETVLITIDRFSLPWCQFCGHRQQALEWGERHGFPQVQLCHYQALGPGLGCWHPVLFSQNVPLAPYVPFEHYNTPHTNDDLIWLLLAYIESLDEA